MELFKCLKCLVIIVILFVFIIFFVYWMNWFVNLVEKLWYECGVDVNFISCLLKVIIIGLNKFGIRVLFVFLKIYLDIRVCLYEVYFFD